MGQKVNPHGMRVGVIKDWDSRWFTSKQAFGDTLVEDYKIRKTLKKQLYAAGVPKIEIERTVDSQTGAPRVKVNVFCAKPGIVIGGLISEVTAGVSGLSWLSYGNTFGINSNGNPLVLDLGILVITFALQIKITVASIIGVIAAIVIYRFI